MNPVSFIDLLSFGGKIPPVLVGTWLVMALLLVFALAARLALARAADPMVPDDGITLRSFAEVLTEGMAGFIRDLLGSHGLASYVGFFGSLFCFILTANSSTPTEDLGLVELWPTVLLPCPCICFAVCMSMNPGWTHTTSIPEGAASTWSEVVNMLMKAFVDE